MNLSRRGLILGGTAMLGGCASATIGPAPTVPSASAALTMQVELLPLAAPLGSPGPLDPSGVVRKELMQRAMAVLDTYPRRIALRDRIYLVDFRKHSGEPRLHEVNLLRGEITTFRTTHGRGSDPVNSGFAHDFSNTPDSFKSSLGAYATAGAGCGRQHGPNGLLDGLEDTNNRARERAIIVHGADYADPEFLAREGKLGRSYGCFSLAHADLPVLRERMGEGRLLLAAT